MQEIINDQDIVGLLQKKETLNQGFRLLVQQYQERLYWHIRRMVHLHEDANDVLQNVFIKVFRNIKNFKGDSKLYTWLYRIATNEAITFINKAKKKKTEGIDNDKNSPILQLKAATFFDGDEIQHKLKLAIEKLPEKQQLVFNMRYYDDMSYQDISEVVGTSVGGLKASYHHAVKKIEAFFKENN